MRGTSGLPSLPFPESFQLPELRVFTLCFSGPAEHDNMDNDWGTNPIEITLSQGSCPILS